MAELRIAYERGGYRLMVSANGIGEKPHGPIWPTPREASRFWDSYRANHPQAVTPLRSADDDDAHPSTSSAEPSGAVRDAGRPLARSGPK